MADVDAGVDDGDDHPGASRHLPPGDRVGVRTRDGRVSRRLAGLAEVLQPPLFVLTGVVGELQQHVVDDTSDTDHRLDRRSWPRGRDGHQIGRHPGHRFDTVDAPQRVDHRVVTRRGGLRLGRCWRLGRRWRLDARRRPDAVAFGGHLDQSTRGHHVHGAGRSQRTGPILDQHRHARIPCGGQSRLLCLGARLDEGQRTLGNGDLDGRPVGSLDDDRVGAHRRDGDDGLVGDRVIDRTDRVDRSGGHQQVIEIVVPDARRFEGNPCSGVSSDSDGCATHTAPAVLLARCEHEGGGERERWPPESTAADRSDSHDPPRPGRARDGSACRSSPTDSTRARVLLEG